MNRTRNKIGAGLLAAAFAFLVGAIIVAKLQAGKTLADPDNPRQVARGKVVYAKFWAVLAYIKSTWPPEIRRAQAEVDRNAARR